MRCPFCGSRESRVIDTREVGDGIRRRRECQSCHQRFTTYEQVAKINLLVIKRDGKREPLSRQKLTDGILMACAKRPISSGDIDQLVSRIESRLYRLGKAEISSKAVGEMVMEELKELDQVAYVRFASVYRSFQDLETLKREVDNMIESESPQEPDDDKSSD